MALLPAITHGLDVVNVEPVAPCHLPLGYEHGRGLISAATGVRGCSGSALLPHPALYYLARSYRVLSVWVCLFVFVGRSTGLSLGRSQLENF
jgi:hypothetical protein